MLFISIAFWIVLFDAVAGEVEVAAIFLDKELVVLDAEARSGGIFAGGGGANGADSDRFFAFFAFAKAEPVDIYVIAENLQLEDMFTSRNFAQFGLHGGIVRPIFTLFCDNAIGNGLVVDKELHAGLFRSSRHLHFDGEFRCFFDIDGVFKPFARLRVAESVAFREVSGI